MVKKTTEKMVKSAPKKASSKKAAGPTKAGPKPKKSGAQARTRPAKKPKPEANGTTTGPGENDISATVESPAKPATRPGKYMGTKTGTDAPAKIRRAANLLKMVADPTRLQLVTMLADGEKHVGALCGELSQSQPAVSHHIALLRHMNMIEPRRQGKNNFYVLTDTGRQIGETVAALMDKLD